MKHLKIIFTLTLVVLAASVLVFFVEAWTTPIIEEENLYQANLAKFEVLSSLVASDLLKDDETPIDPADFDFSDSTIEELLIIEGKGYIYTAEFSGYQSKVKYMIAIDNSGNITGFKVLVQGETPGYGDTIMDEEYRLQFEGLSTDSALNGEIDDVAGLSGAPTTMGAFRQSLKALMEFHQSNFEGVIIETPEQRETRLLLEAFPEGIRYEDVTVSYEANEDIEIIYEVYDSGDVLLGYVYYVDTVGVSLIEPTYIKFFVGFDLDKQITGFALLEDTETPGRTNDMYFDSYGNAFVGDEIASDDYGIDAIADSTMTNNLIQDVVREIATYHIDYVLLEGEVVERPENIFVTDEDLKLAFLEGITFNSIYSDFKYNEYIGNVYEVLDVADVLLGHVYYVELEGRDNAIHFVIGINIDGTTNLIEILFEGESWQLAADSEFSTYDGSYGEFVDTPWLNFFEGVSILDLVLDPVDDISGVSTTTGSMLTAIEEVLHYHLFEIVGGAE